MREERENSLGWELLGRKFWGFMSFYNLEWFGCEVLGFGYYSSAPSKPRKTRKIYFILDVG